mgnify:CR=1 FL=1
MRAAEALDGVLFVARMPDLRRLAFDDEYLRYWAPRPEPDEPDPEDH